MDDIQTVFNNYLPEPHASLMNGILLGAQIRDQQELYQQLKITGLLHIAVLSGANISILTSLLSSILSGFSKYVLLMITILICLFFCLISRFEAPIVRASFMSILTSVSTITGRRSIALYVLFLSGLISLMLWPDWISSLSFYLSYSATLGLILFSSGSGSREGSNTGFRIISYIKDDISTSLAAQTFTAPIIFFALRNISLISPFSNLFISWAIAPLMLLGIFTVVLGMIHPVLATLPSFLCYGLLTYILKVIAIISSIPYVFWEL